MNGSRTRVKTSNDLRWRSFLLIFFMIFGSETFLHRLWLAEMVDLC
jgi:hypothetical protein